MSAEKRWTNPRELVGVVRYEWSARRAWTSRRALIRGLWWTFIRRYPTEICTCGRPVSLWIGDTFWRTTDELWARVAGWPGWEKELGEFAYLGPPGTLCPRCFTERAEAKGIRLRWEPACLAGSGLEETT